MKTEELIRILLANLGEDPEREGLANTPGRVSRALTELTRGRDIRSQPQGNSARNCGEPAGRRRHCDV
jgi:GTP cyclohydrolase I